MDITFFNFDQLILADIEVIRDRETNVWPPH